MPESDAAGERFSGMTQLAALGLSHAPRYLSLRLNPLKDGARGGTAYAHIMRTIAQRLSDRQIEAVSRYHGGLALKFLACPAASERERDSHQSAAHRITTLPGKHEVGSGGSSRGPA